MSVATFLHWRTGSDAFQVNQQRLILPELKGAATIAAEKKKRPRKVSDAPDNKETWHSEEGLQSKKESDRR